MTLKTIVKKWLTENGYDGLHYEDCGCRKNDLFPCGADPGLCMPGYIKWGKDEFGNREWTVGPKKRSAGGIFEMVWLTTTAFLHKQLLVMVGDEMRAVGCSALMKNPCYYRGANPNTITLGHARTEAVPKG